MHVRIGEELGESGRGAKRVPRRDTGFTVAELMIASAILLTVLVSVMGAVVFSAQSAQMQSQREEATNIANARLEVARNLPYDRIGVAGRNPSGDILASEVTTEIAGNGTGSYTVDTVVEWQQDPLTLKRMNKKISVNVAWLQPRVGHISLSTTIFGKSLLSNVGDVEVRARYMENSQPVAAVACSVAGATNQTKADGIAFFGAVPIGVQGIGIVAPVGYVYDLSGATSRTVAADSLTTVIVTFQKSSRVTYTFRDAGTRAVIGGVALSLSKTDGSVCATGTTGDADGKATFDNLVVGGYSLDFTKQGYSSAPQALSVAAEGSALEVEVLLSPGPKVGSIAVSVQDTNHANLRGASVTLQGTSESLVIQPQATFDNGVATFVNLPPDTYTVGVTYPGYQTQTAVNGVVLAAGAAGSMEFHLSPNSTKGQMSITTKRNGDVRGGIEVDIYGPETDHWNDRYHTRLTSDANGNIRTGDLPAGSYTVKAHDRPSPDSGVAVIVSGGTVSIVEVNRTSGG